MISLLTRRGASKRAWQSRKKMAAARAVAQASQATDSVSVDDPVKLESVADTADKRGLR